MKTNNIPKNNKILNRKDIIREGELLKFSYKNNKFDKRCLILDKEKIVLKKITENEMQVILFSDILLLTTEIIDKKILQSAQSYYIFEIRTKDQDSFFFSSKSMTDLETWIQAINQVFSISQDNEKIKELTKLIVYSNNEIYCSEAKLINHMFNILGVFAVKDLRNIF